MDSFKRNSRPRSAEGMDPRIPIAWKHREMTFSNPCALRASSSSIASSSSDDREEVPMVRPLSRHSNMSEHHSAVRNKFISDNYRNSHLADFHGTFRSNTSTLRSSRSVPALTFAAAMESQEPCPIHGGESMRRHGSLFDIRSPPLPGIPMLDKKRLYGSKHSLVGGHFPYHPEMPQYLPPHMINPMMRPSHPFGMPMIVEPIPTRDHFNKNGEFIHNFGKGYPKKEPLDPYSVEQVCCKGHLIVLWIILGVVTVGVILGIIMGVTIT